MTARRVDDGAARIVGQVSSAGGTGSGENGAWQRGSSLAAGSAERLAVHRGGVADISITLSDGIPTMVVIRR
ncbi:hypothetical protein [Streptomyces pseudogriseolus]|uniref:Uncharacterized protein n=1 Tax=Streptomyces pseudogriseolus TaxID=36817 RepID=A0ABQ2TBD9_STREZ|nr:hypothetical protein [Streptomyces rubiginosus]GGS58965.1 hypothetical protein GCM10010285_42960 [Streptomyces rubiginosus]